MVVQGWGLVGMEVGYGWGVWVRDGGWGAGKIWRRICRPQTKTRCPRCSEALATPLIPKRFSNLFDDVLRYR